MPQTKIKTDKEIEAMRESGAMLKTVLDSLEAKIAPGINMIEIDLMARKELKALGGKPAFFGYLGFPGAICISVNEEIVHGTPRDIELVEGDIVGLDFGVKYRGMITDSARTLPIGTVSAQIEKLMKTTERSLYAGIDVLKDGVHTGDIAVEVESVLNEGGYGIIRDLVGHGVGHTLHEEPNIPNYGTRGEGPTLKAGMTVAIEPMATLGGHEITVDKNDRWTIRTVDGSIAAHYEHTILITDDSYEVLT